MERPAIHLSRLDSLGSWLTDVGLFCLWDEGTAGVALILEEGETFPLLLADPALGSESERLRVTVGQTLDDGIVTVSGLL